MQYKPPSDLDRQAFHQGSSRHAYEMLGAHQVRVDGKTLWHFSVWAPNARAVSVTGEFCTWDPYAHPMEKQHDGTWELRLPERLFQVAGDPVKFSYEDAAEKLLAYKYAVFGMDDQLHLKADPFRFASELRPNTAGLLCDLSGYTWHDQAWLEKRAAQNPYRSPINIYEIHLGSWRRGEGDTLLSYGEIADQLIPYIQEMGYTHVELLPVMEHPLDMSWGYQVTGYYSPTARHGKPIDFMRFVDRLHQANIGVLLDWVPAHFARDEVGLRQFDGTPCYEHVDPRRAEMQQWGTMMFDFARGESCSFLLSNACFWLEYYHVDGLRCDAVSSMLYHDFGREDNWVPNVYGGKENLEAIAFLRRLNETIYHDFPGALSIAEESSAYPMVTQPTHLGGLGFGFKWNMGWMNDVLSYIRLDFDARKERHNMLTFGLQYAFSENYILPFSHDEVVHGKYSMLDKQPGDLWRKFAGLRALYGFTMAHPGKKLLFMGSEFAHYIEWKYDDQLDWFLLLCERHPDMRLYVRELNRFYLMHKPLYEVEDSWSGFQWLVPNDRDNAVVVFCRYDAAGNAIICASNFTPTYHPLYRFGLPLDGTVSEMLNSDLDKYGGSNQHNPLPLQVQQIPSHGLPYSVEICLPPLATVYFLYDKGIAPQNIQEHKEE